MTASRRCAALCVAAAVLFACPLVQAASPDAGKAKVKEVCAACHGENGNSATADYPKLAGQHPDYLAKALRDYKSGLRKNPVMAGFAAALSKQDIENLAAYYAAQPRVVSAKQ